MISVSDRLSALNRRYPVWTPRMLHEVLDATAASYPDRDFVVTDAAVHSYADIARWSRRIAAGLRAAGIQQGEHVALLMANFPDFVAVKYALSRIGAVCVPVNFLNRRDELAYVLEQSDAVALICMDSWRDLDYLGMLDELAPGWQAAGGGARFPKLRKVWVHPANDAPVRAGAAPLAGLAGEAEFSGVAPSTPDALSDIIYTSGTTGAPKGVMLTHDMVLREAFCSAWCRAYDDGWRMTFSLPMYHVYGYIEGILTMPFVAGAIIPQTAFRAETTVAAINRHRADDVLLVPTMTVLILDHLRRNPTRMPTLRAVLSSGQRSPLDVWEQIIEHFGQVELTTGYGMTEVTASSAFTRLGDSLEQFRITNGRLRDAGVAGEPSLGGRLIVYRIVDPQTGIEVPHGEVGELQARGPCVTKGYYNKPAETAAAFTSDGWFRSGDLARWLPDDYIQLAGRTKESYRCGGEQVMPTEIEDVLTAHPAVRQAHVVPVPDDRMGEAGVAFIVRRPDVPVTGDELIALCRDRLARFKVPKHVLFIEEPNLPVTPSGRARKFLLSQRAIAELGLQ
ncbi:class I adenylate-forming enzyme family protein [Pontitalea aquivivens]|uniref:class I adenylate-forming enzyme family protein n=1 Tax=Pontitalea aquivivens TaxID=3388663 RepID=UPI003970B50E